MLVYNLGFEFDEPFESYMRFDGETCRFTDGDYGSIEIDYEELKKAFLSIEKMLHGSSDEVREVVLEHGVLEKKWKVTRNDQRCIEAGIDPNKMAAVMSNDPVEGQIECPDKDYVYACRVVGGE